MAGHSDDYKHGEMDIHQNVSTYNLFMALTKWGSLYTAAFILFITVAFAVKGAGLLPAIIATAVMLVLGFFLLKSPAKSDTSH
ncbi:MAG: aa3-type cytochrome c oxidase subunit IV [Asticcacaulis sp.]